MVVTTSKPPAINAPCSFSFRTWTIDLLIVFVILLSMYARPRRKSSEDIGSVGVSCYFSEHGVLPVEASTSKEPSGCTTFFTAFPVAILVWRG